MTETYRLVRNDAYSDWVNDMVAKIIAEVPQPGTERAGGEDILNALCAISAGVIGSIVEDAHDPEVVIAVCTRLGGGTAEELARLRPQLKADAGRRRKPS